MVIPLFKEGCPNKKIRKLQMASTGRLRPFGEMSNYELCPGIEVCIWSAFETAGIRQVQQYRALLEAYLRGCDYTPRAATPPHAERFRQFTRLNEQHMEELTIPLFKEEGDLDRKSDSINRP